MKSFCLRDEIVLTFTAGSTKTAPCAASFPMGVDTPRFGRASSTHHPAALGRGAGDTLR
ncbi:MAG: hypothetical protein IGR92_15230 [Leptolyngbyaceae cyanobacterium T60_A2020_046]|nr:hypothetical protein [Leptolyngbyaceae cyanobacterium T60_A2020_046]